MKKLFDKNESGVAQLVESKNQWAIELWKKGCHNNWLPMEVDMSEDIKQWKDKTILSDAERLIIKRALGLFAAGESMVANSVDTVESVYLTDGAVRQYLLRKQFEESLHNFTVLTCVEAYGLSVKEVAEAYYNIPAVAKKNQFLCKSLDSFNKDFDIETIEGKRKFIKNFFIFYMVCEGTWFFANFALIMAIGRNQKLKGLFSQIKMTLKDEGVHVEFGTNILNQLQREYPEVWSKEFKEELISVMREGAEICKDYMKDVLPKGILGVNNGMTNDYIDFLADSRLNSIKLDTIYGAKNNPFPWLAEVQEGKQMTAFFEGRETNYQQAGALEDDL